MPLTPAMPPAVAKSDTKVKKDDSKKAIPKATPSIDTGAVSNTTGKKQTGQTPRGKGKTEETPRGAAKTGKDSRKVPDSARTKASKKPSSPTTVYESESGRILEDNTESVDAGPAEPVKGLLSAPAAAPVAVAANPSAAADMVAELALAFVPASAVETATLKQLLAERTELATKEAERAAALEQRAITAERKLAAALASTSAAALAAAEERAAMAEAAFESMKALLEEAETKIGQLGMSMPKLASPPIRAPAARTPVGGPPPLPPPPAAPSPRPDEGGSEGGSEGGAESGVYGEEHARAAVRVQAVQRGRSSRSVLRLEAGGSPATPRSGPASIALPEYTAEQTAAATKVQALTRGRSARLNLAYMQPAERPRPAVDEDDGPYNVSIEMVSGEDGVEELKVKVTIFSE